MNGLLGNEHLCVCVSRGVPVCKCSLCVWLCACRVPVGQVLLAWFRNTLSTIALSLRPSLTDFYLNKPKDGGRYCVDGGVTDLLQPFYK